MGKYHLIRYTILLPRYSGFLTNRFANSWWAATSKSNMKKFPLLRLMISVVLLVFGQARAEKPNIIFIMADDLGYGDLGCYGQKEIQTPHIDHLAAEGMRFTQAYAGSTVCAPTRGVLMTGYHTGHSRVRGNSGWKGADRERVLILQLYRD